MTQAQPELTCPSARCEPGATLIGILRADGQIANLRTPLQIDADFVAQAHRQGNPEARMRFAAPCQKASCEQWTGQGCGVVKKVLAHLAPEPGGALQPCVIRDSCRWYAERRRPACHACRFVVTDQAALAAE